MERMMRLETKIVAAVCGMMLLVASPCLATTYYVDGTAGACTSNYSIANRNCTGSDGNSYATIGAGEDAATQPGDIVYVRSGTYDERVTPGYSGSAEGGYITFAAYPGEEAFSSGLTPRGSGTVIMRGFTIGAYDYIKIIGFEITHDDTDHNQGVVITSSSADHIQIYDNYFHHLYNSAGDSQQGAIHAGDTITPSYLWIRGNKIQYNDGYYGGTSSNGSTGIYLKGPTYILSEYNEISHVADGFNPNNQYHIIRNNYIHDLSNDEDYDNPTAAHADFVQISGTLTCGYYQIDSNMCLGNYDASDGHFLLFRNTGSTKEYYTVRNNVFYLAGDFVAQVAGTDYCKLINNVFAYANWADASGKSMIRFNYEGDSSQYSNNGYIFNNIIYDCYAASAIINIETGSDAVTATNACYLNNATHSSCTVGDPSFTNYPTDFSITTESNAKDAGRYITLVNNANGSGTEFIVDDATFFCDGWGLTGGNGDLIKVGSNDPVRITGISGNTITVASSTAWSDNDEVYYGGQDTSPDIGAFEYKSSYTLTATYTNSGGTVTVTPSDTSLVRFVVVYEDNIPQTPDYDSPYTFSVGSGTIKAQVYSLYASTTPVITATEGTIPSTMKGVTVSGGVSITP